jgi:hypothetical protein
MWAIWHAKRKVIFEEIYQSPMATVAFVNRFLLDLEATREAPSSMAGAMVRGRGATTRSPQPEWIAPPAGKDKINVDAAVAKMKRRGRWPRCAGRGMASTWELRRQCMQGFLTRGPWRL